MTQYLVKRLALFIPTLFLASVLIFSLMRVLPGDPALLRLVGDAGATEWTQEGPGQGTGPVGDGQKLGRTVLELGFGNASRRLRRVAVLRYAGQRRPQGKASHHSPTYHHGHWLSDSYCRCLWESCPR